MSRVDDPRIDDGAPGEAAAAPAQVLVDGATYGVEVAADPADALEALEEMVLAWGGESQTEGPRSRRIGVPVRAGLRRGWVAGPVEASAGRAPGTARLELRIDREQYTVDRAAFTVLLLAAAGALITLLAPLVPRLLPLVPMGVLLAVGAWLFVVARLRNSGPEELLESIERDVELRSSLEDEESTDGAPEDGAPENRQPTGRPPADRRHG